MCALLVTDGVLALQEVHRAFGCTGPAASGQGSCRRMCYMGKLVPSSNLLGYCAIISAEGFSLLCKNKMQLGIALSSSK